MTKKVKYIWHKQTVASDCVTIDCPVFDHIKDFRRDPTGYYLLIRVDYPRKRIEVAVCDGKHNIVRIFRGKAPVDVYEGIFRYEKRHRKRWFLDKGHAAYLGKELRKAQIAIESGSNDYIQE